MANAYDAQFDRWIGRSVPLGPARNAKVITPSDTKDLCDATGDALPHYPRSLYVGGAGNIVVIMAASKDDSVTVTFTGVAAGSVLPIQVRRVKSTSTTATAIAALYDD